jgi:hypothetical protein
MNEPMAVSANRFQVLRPMRPAMRSELPMMDLQQIRFPAAGTPPSILIENLAAVQPVHGVHEPGQCDALFAVIRLGHQLISGECPEAKEFSCHRQPAYCVAGQHFCSPHSHGILLSA